MSFTAAQCRAARSLVAASQEDLANASGVAKATIATFESGKRMPYERTLRDIRTALEAAGVLFLDAGATVDGGPGVRLKAST